MTAPSHPVRRNDTFRHLWDTHHHHIRQYLARRAPRDDIDDLCVAVFETAWRRLDTIPAGDAARWWLYRVAANHIANHHRTNRRRGRLHTKLAGHHATHTSPPALDDTPELAAAFATLRADDQELLILTYWDDLRPDDIAALHNTSTATIHKRLSRARTRLKNAYTDSPNPAPAGHSPSDPIVRTTP